MDPLEREEIIRQRDYYIWRLTQNLPRIIRLVVQHRVAVCNQLLEKSAA